MDKIIAYDFNGKPVIKIDESGVEMDKNFVKDAMSEEEIKEKMIQSKIVDAIKE